MSTVWRSNGYRIGLLAVGAILLLSAVPLYGNDYATATAVSVATYAILGLGLNIVLGYAGLVDLGYAAFFAIGAYTTAILTTKFGIDFWVTLPVAVALAGLTGALLGYPVLRLRNDYLAIVTLGFGEIVRLSFLNWDYVGGPEGVWSVPPPQLLGRVLYTENDQYIIVAVLLLIAMTLASNLGRSRLGLGWLAMREDEHAAEASGVPTLRLKILAYSLGGMWGGLAGAFFAARIGIVNPQSFTFTVSVTVLIIIGLGGLGSIRGVMLGSLLVIGLPELLRGVQAFRLVAFGAALLLIMMLRPQGLLPHQRRPAPLIPKTLQPPEPLGSIDPNVPLLKVRGLTHRFGGVVALSGVDFDISAGEIVSLIGPNGAGKTTVFNCITGAQMPQQGEIWLGGQRLGKRRPHSVVAAGMARTFQGVRLFKGLSVFENVAVGLYWRQTTRIWDHLLRTPASRREERWQREEVGLCLAFVGIAKASAKLASQLAYADQRRVELGRALASRPRLLLLDEPAAGMNPSEKRQLMSLIKAIRAAGTTILVIEHDMSLVMSISDRVIVLDQGIVIKEGPPTKVQTDPRVIAAYLGIEDTYDADVAAQSG